MSQPPQTPPPPDLGPPSGGDFGTQPAPGYGPPPAQSNGVAIAALVCGIVAFILSWIPVINVVALVLAIIAVITGIIGVRRAGQTGGGKGMAIGGLITGVLGGLISLMILVFLASFFADPELREPFDRMLEGEDPQEVIEDLEREMERQSEDAPG